MADRILEKLDILDMQEKILLDRRTKKNRLQDEEGGKTSIIPLTFDFLLEPEEATAAPIRQRAPKPAADKSQDTRRAEKFTSLKCELEPIKSDFEKPNLKPHIVPSTTKSQKETKLEENTKSRYSRDFHYLKDTTEAENSEHRQAFRRSPSSSVFSPVLSKQSNAYEEKDFISLTVHLEKNPNKLLDSTGHLEDPGNKRRQSPLKHGSSTDQSTADVRLSQGCSTRKDSLLPLCFEDELKNPNARIIHVTPPRHEPPQEVTTSAHVPPHKAQNERNPIIFHDTQYVQTLLLTKHSISAHILKNEKIYPRKKINFVLERNCAIFKSLINDEPITLSKPQKTELTTRREAIPARAHDKGHQTVKHKLKKRTKDQTLENRAQHTLHHPCQTFPSLTQMVVAYLDKTLLQEKSAPTDRSGRMLSTAKPTRRGKLSALPLRSDSMPTKNRTDVRKLNNATPLDNLLYWPEEN